MNYCLTFKVIESKIEQKYIYLVCNFIRYIGLSFCITFLNVIELNNLKTIYFIILYLSFVFHYLSLSFLEEPKRKSKGWWEGWGTIIIVRCEKKEAMEWNFEDFQRKRI